MLFFVALYLLISLRLPSAFSRTTHVVPNLGSLRIGLAYNMVFCLRATG